MAASRRPNAAIASGREICCISRSWADRAGAIQQLLAQRTNASDMIFPVAKMVSYFSHLMRLLSGDLILTGTSEGIGRMKIGETVRAARRPTGRDRDCLTPARSLLTPVPSDPRRQ
ncbi:MAG: 2-hydroxyhepta-2,4-diene,7-dioate isomerase [Rhodospirillales bacterium]|jgi:2-keto-4-pentenoate hydratase/2-oxohepta-3-ene-1,7-dioic acid hydratase in catechol pathway|nr:2-hydroxyhepta-2,4-diene,7-dioate isomerase [Rhodospirillales bacterium]